MQSRQIFAICHNSRLVKCRKKTSTKKKSITSRVQYFFIVNMRRKVQYRVSVPSRNVVLLKSRRHQSRTLTCVKVQRLCYHVSVTREMSHGRIYVHTMHKRSLILHRGCIVEYTSLFDQGHFPINMKLTFH